MISKPLHVNIVNCHKYIFLTLKWLLIKEASTKQDLAMVCHYFSHTQEKEFKSTLSKPTYTYSGLLINITVPNINQSKVVFFSFRCIPCTFVFPTEDNHGRLVEQCHDFIEVSGFP